MYDVDMEKAILSQFVLSLMVSLRLSWRLSLFRSHTCITFELLSINLYELIKKNKFQGFSLQLVRKFAHSLLQCLDTLYRNKIIHCDMKPENVLLKQQGRSGIKVSNATSFLFWKFCHIKVTFSYIKCHISSSFSNIMGKWKYIHFTLFHFLCSRINIFHCQG